MPRKAVAVAGAPTRRTRAFQALRRIAQGVIVELSIALMGWRLTAAVMVLVMPHPLALWVIRPFFTRGFLLGIARHEGAADAIANLLQRRRAGRAVASLLRYHAVLGSISKEPEVAALVPAVLRRPGLGPFLQSFLLEAGRGDLADLLRHRSTATIIADGVCSSRPEGAAAAVHAVRGPLAPVVVKLCMEPGLEAWGRTFCSHPGMESWLARFLACPRGAVFSQRVMLSPGFADYVEAFLKSSKARFFTIHLLQQPGVSDFVTWLNRGTAMRRWFADIASRDSAMVFVTEMLLEPGLDRFIVKLLLLQGNDAALRAMLEHYVRAEGSLPQVVATFAEKPRAATALATVIISPGFLDTFVLRRLLLQPGLAEVVVDAVFLVGLRGLAETVIPLVLATLATAVQLSAGGDLMEQVRLLLTELPPADEAVTLILLLLG